MIKKYFTVWWIPIITYSVPVLIFIFGNILKKDEIIDLSLIVFFINILGNIISAIVQIVIKKWYFIFPQLIVTIFLFVITSVIFTLSPPDYYGVNKTIPKNIEIEIPIETEISEEDLNVNDFKIAAYSQPGIYTYYTNYQPKEKGSLFIRVFEITSNDKLSEKEILDRSKIIVNELDAKMYSGEFVIYEGSWGDKYGARIELWYQPDNGMEYKIAEKNYVVEGWMR
ncbi:MAG: hypothetical protein RSF68_06685 [Myroides sp.]